MFAEASCCRIVMYRLVASAIVVLHVILLLWSGYIHSPVQTEVAHLAAGISHHQLGRFDLFRVNPPLVRMIAAVPVMFADPVTCWKNYDRDPMVRPEFRVEADFFVVNGIQSFWFITLARWACVPFSVLGACVCWSWARQLYGPASGLAALTLWCFSPYVLGHASVIMPDAHAAAMGVTTIYVFQLWLRRPQWRLAFGCGLLLGLAELCKFTLVVFYPLLFLLWFVYRLPARASMRCDDWREQLGMLAVAVGISLCVVNLGYGLEGSFKPLGSFRFQTMLLTGRESLEDIPRDGANRFENTWLEQVPVPLPSNYVQGIDTQRRDFERGLRSYLRGEWKRGGWWYYYLYALAVKLPTGTLILTILAVVVTGSTGTYSVAWHEEFLLLLPLAAILGLVSSQTGFSTHSRYVIPALPFLFIWISKSARSFQLQNRIVALVTSLAILWSVASSLLVFPHSLSFFNELAGGPQAGHYHLLDSNIAWGQDIRLLRQWLDRHPSVQSLGLAAGVPYDSQIVGIAGFRPPNQPTPGWYAIDVNHLRDWREEFSYFLSFKPVATAGYSIYIYHITLDEANRVRRELGLPEITAKEVTTRSMEPESGRDGG